MIQTKLHARWATLKGKFYVELHEDELGFKIHHNYGRSNLGNASFEEAMRKAEHKVKVAKEIDGHNMSRIT